LVDGFNHGCDLLRWPRAADFDLDDWHDVVCGWMWQKGQRRLLMRPNVRAKLPAEAGTVSPD
jgi:hypothetical protein